MGLEYQNALSNRSVKFEKIRTKHAFTRVNCEKN